MRHPWLVLWYPWLSHPFDVNGCPSASLAVNVQSNTAQAASPAT